MSRIYFCKLRNGLAKEDLAKIYFRVVKKTTVKVPNGEIIFRFGEHRKLWRNKYKFCMKCQVPNYVIALND